MNGGPALGCGIPDDRRRTVAGKFLQCRRFAAVLFGALATCTIPASAQSPRPAEAPVGIEIAAEPLAGFEHGKPSQRRFGMLEFRGGLVLTSRFKQFGGASAIRVPPDGAHFLGLTDKGWWVQGRIAYYRPRPTRSA